MKQPRAKNGDLKKPHNFGGLGFPSKPKPSRRTLHNLDTTPSLPQITAFWDTVFNSVGEAIAIINVDDFSIVEVNKVFLEEYGQTREQVIGHTCHAVTHHETNPCGGPEHSCPLLTAVTTGQISAVEHIHYTKNGKRIAFEVSAAPIRNSQGRIVQVVHVARDITERKLAQQQLIMNDRLASIGMLASGIAHEVGNPLTVINGIRPYSTVNGRIAFRREGRPAGYSRRVAKSI